MNGIGTLSIRQRFDLHVPDSKLSRTLRFEIWIDIERLVIRMTPLPFHTTARITTTRGYTEPRLEKEYRMEKRMAINRLLNVKWMLIEC